MEGVFLTKRAILVEFDSVGRVFLVFHRIVVALLAFCASQGDFYSHLAPPDKRKLVSRVTRQTYAQLSPSHFGRQGAKCP